MSNQQQPQTVSGKGTVKQINSGDTIVIYATPQVGPPGEILIGLNGIRSPLIARRPQPTSENKEQRSKDEPCAYAAREFLRKKFVGKSVFYTYEVPAESAKTNNKVQVYHGHIYDGEDSNGENVAELLVSMGLAEVWKGQKRGGSKPNEFIKKLEELQESAKAAGKGIYSPDAAKEIRDIVWDVTDLQSFKETYDNIPIPAIVEQVIDGGTLRLQLIPDSNTKKVYYIKLMLTGIKTPLLSNDSQKSSEEFADQAKFFTEIRVLQRDVKVYLESISNKIFLGTVLHPNGNIAVHLLNAGLAKCVNWSVKYATHDDTNLRDAEWTAKKKQLRIWKNFDVNSTDNRDKFEALVVEVINGDALLLKLNDGSFKKIFLASIRPPRPLNANETGKKIRPLYDIPYMLEAREFLRRKLIGNYVTVHVDYTQPASSGFPEKVCCTVKKGEFDVSYSLVSKGLATVVKYRSDNDQRSYSYYELITAEDKAKQAKKNLHSTEHEVLRIVDVTLDLKTAKQYFSLLKRVGSLKRIDAVVEFVSSGSRFRLFLPDHNYVMTFLLSGISCVRPSRETPSGKLTGDAHGDEAMNYAKSKLMQRNVIIEIDSIDKGGNFIGHLFDSNQKNFATDLVNKGYADVHYSASKGPYYQELEEALELAQSLKLKMWEKYEPVKTEDPNDDKKERTIDFKKVSVTALKEDPTYLMFYAQHFEDGPKLEEMMTELREEFETNPPLVGAYTPKKGDMCAAKYSYDGLWYRARITKLQGSEILVTFVDFGNKEPVSIKQIASLPQKFQSIPVGAHEYSLAFVKLPNDPENVLDARNAFNFATAEGTLMLNVEYQVNPISFVTLKQEDKEDIGKDLLEKGYFIVDKMREKRFQKVMTDYAAAEDTARKNRRNLWMYGDIREDDAKEFG